MTLRPIYREHAPPRDLSSHVACYWTTRHEPSESAGLSLTDRVLPDACMDVLFDVARGEATLVGTMTQPLAISTTEPMDVLGVRFHPGAIGAVLSLPAREVTDGTLAMEAVWGAGARDLARRLQETPTTRRRLHLIEAELRRRIAAGPGSDPLVRAAAGLMVRAGGRVRVRTLLQATGFGERQLERRFLAAVGIPPQTASRVLRFRTALGSMHDTPGAALSRVALEAGYHDQAHFTREFRTFAGEPPGAYRRRRGIDDGSVQDPAALVK